MNRLQAIGSIRKNLKNGGHSIGSWMQIPHPCIAEIMGQSGYDWVAIDMEHGAISVHQLPDLFRALELGDTLPLVRVAHGNEKDCKQALDAGAGGIIVPMVESAKQLEKVMDVTRWPPAGKRGVTFSRASLFGKNFNEYMKEAQQPLLIAMIENINAIEKLDDILQVKGLDAIMIGPYDLSASMGVTAKFDHPEFTKAIRDIRSKSEFANIPCGVHVVSPFIDDLQEKVDDNYRFIAYSIDSVFLNHAVARPNIT
jgi:2-dehydro-3-deoxyglucarate aldolase